MSTWLLWLGAAAFIAAVFSTEYFLVRRGDRSRVSRLRAFADPWSLLCGVAVLVLLLTVLTDDDLVLAWGTAMLWALAVTLFARLLKSAAHTRNG
ncbi:hypothetical protein [Streptomyces tsukubensis]|uniref:Uncharacterized protein n=1 Tax=Streptomyces tsukubensis TaxID=83656 RepID=A0A1V3ZZT6_9ACTN|nr:hypothetical protein [Streptomyces tsukubensis]OON71888.1 hypothetical protein B1H18_32050 [Streptomyces tsukubensis]QFR91841.1 hypothetical protein GBW32_00735 [Streptomyces tsukubensis]